MNTTTASTSTETQMKLDYLQSGCTRQDALRNGQLYDITRVKAALNGMFSCPAAITLVLWQALAGERPFNLEHPLLLQLCRCAIASIATDRVERRQQGVFSETVFLRTTLAGCTISFKLVCHPGDSGEAVLTLLEASQASQLEL